MRNLWISLMSAHLLGAILPLAAQGLQEPSPAAFQEYVRLISNHFRVPESEVRIFAETTITPDELPVVLRISRLSGIAPAAILAQRRSGERWQSIAQRYQIGATSFYVAIPEDAVDARVERLHRLFSETPAAARNQIELRDEEIVVLCNLDVLARELGASYGQVLAARAAAPSFADAVPRLARGR